MNTSGMTSFDALSSELDMAALNDDVHGIVLVIDSPGGEVSGAFDFADHVRAVAQQKPVIALAQDLALSGGFLVASAATEIIATQSSVTGSIGVVQAHIDRTGHNEQDGIKVTHIFAGARKIDGSPDVALDSEMHKALQAEVDSFFDLFVSKVSEFRGMSEKAIRNTEAGVFIGEEAQSIGLIDSVGTLEMAIDRAKNAAKLGADNGPAISVKHRRNHMKDIFDHATSVTILDGGQRVAVGPKGFLATFGESKEWKQIKAPWDASDHVIAVDPQSESSVSILTESGKTFVSIDAGSTWRLNKETHAPEVTGDGSVEGSPESCCGEEESVLARLNEFRTLCVAAGLPQELAFKLLDSKITTEAAKALILELKATQDENTPTVGRNAPSDSDQSGDDIIAECEKLGNDIRAKAGKTSASSV